MRRKEGKLCFHSKHEIPGLVFKACCWICYNRSCDGVLHDTDWFLYDKVTVLEAEKRAVELDPRSQAIKEALNPWRTHDSKREDDP